MKKVIFLVFFFVTIGKATSQELVRVFGGINLTNIEAHRILSSDGSDSTGYNPDNFLLPRLGVDVQFKLTEKSKIVTGLSVEWMGAENFSKGYDGIFKIDDDFKLGYLRLPIQYHLMIFKNLYLTGGLSLNYNFRKTTGFYIAYPDGSTDSYYQPWHIAFLGGLRYDLARISFGFNYHQGLTKLYDSKDLDTDYHVYGILYGIQFSVGYLFEDN